MSPEQSTYPPPLPDFLPEHFWNLDLTIAGILAKTLSHLAENPVGYPSQLTCDEWQEILHRMASGFQAYYDADARFGTEAPNDALDLLKEWWCALWT